jgi:hypothetical protein
MNRNRILSYERLSMGRNSGSCPSFEGSAALQGGTCRAEARRYANQDTTQFRVVGEFDCPIKQHRVANQNASQLLE